MILCRRRRNCWTKGAGGITGYEWGLVVESDMDYHVGLSSGISFTAGMRLI